MDNTNSNEEINYTELSAAKRTGNRIRRIREAKGLSQAELGQLVGLNADRIQKYENGARRPKTDLLDSIASALSVSSLALSDLNLEDRLGVMYTLFMIEDYYGIDFHSTDLGTAISFRDDDIGEYVRQWMERHKDFSNDCMMARTESERKNYVYSYELWKWNFPQKKDKDVLRKNLEHQIGVLQERICDLQKQIKNLDDL